jgi:hypothetical protein
MWSCDTCGRPNHHNPLICETCGAAAPGASADQVSLALQRDLAMESHFRGLAFWYRVGAPPTITSTYKCQSYLYNSNERCQLTLTAPAKIYLAVTGDSTALARFNVDGFQIQ